MKKQSKLAIALLVGLPLVTMTSCGGDDPVVEEAIEEVVEEVPEENTTYYQIPSPDEMFGFIKETGLPFNGELLNDISNSDNYTDPKMQALNFGIYSADLAYTAAFQEFNETTKYFGTIQKMSEPLGLNSAFDKSLIERAQANLDNADSLVAITNTSYFAIVDYLENNDQGDRLGLIASAGWLETLYVTANTINYKKDTDAVDRLADQKLTLENLLDYLAKYESDASVAEVTVWFKDLETVFATLSETEADSGSGFKKKESGKMVLGGGSSISMTEDQFNSLKDKINEIRNNIVKSEA
ncbi:MAG: hypothetical protein ACPGSO_06075 [Vicingaceae bacterium]